MIQDKQMKQHKRRFCLPLLLMILHSVDGYDDAASGMG
jgi:hypothetical protein